MMSSMAIYYSQPHVMERWRPRHNLRVYGSFARIPAIAIKQWQQCSKGATARALMRKLSNVNLGSLVVSWDAFMYRMKTL